MTEQEKAINTLKIIADTADKNTPCGLAEIEMCNVAIAALEKTFDKECSRCKDKGKCAIYDNFNIDYCSDWSVEE